MPALYQRRLSADNNYDKTIMSGRCAQTRYGIGESRRELSAGGNHEKTKISQQVNRRSVLVAVGRIERPTRGL